MLQSLPIVRPSTTLYYKTIVYYKACTQHFPVLPFIAKLAASTSQHYFILQSLHGILLRTTYFVLQSLHKALPSTTLYYKACPQYVPVLLCTTRLHKACPSTSLYHKAFTRARILSCKRQQNYTRSSGAKQPSRNHYTAITCKHICMHL